MILERGGGGGKQSQKEDPKKGKKKKKKKKKRPNSGYCQNTCLANRKRGGVRGREIHASPPPDMDSLFPHSPESHFLGCCCFFPLSFFKGFFSPIRPSLLLSSSSSFLFFLVFSLPFPPGFMGAKTFPPPPHPSMHTDGSPHPPTPPQKKKIKSARKSTETFLKKKRNERKVGGEEGGGERGEKKPQFL